MKNNNSSLEKTAPANDRQPTSEQDTPTKGKYLSSEILSVIEEIRKEQFKNCVIGSEDGRTFLHAESIDGESRFMLEKTVTADKGVISESKIAIARPKDKESRLQRVCDLRKKGMTQTEIAQYTMTSQKTVSNDIKELKNQGRLK